MGLIVNGEPIPDALIQEEFGQIKSYFERTTQVSCCDRDDEFLEKAKANLIGRALVTQEALRTIPKLTDDELDLAVRHLKRKHGGEKNFYASFGLTPADHEFVRQSVDTEIRIDKFVKSQTGSVDPTEEESRRLYSEKIEQFTTEAETQAQHIFKSFRSDMSREALFRQACDIRKRLASGEDFFALASEFSDKPSEEIDLGWFKRGELMDEFEYVAFSMSEGEISPVFASHHGFHIAQVIGVRPATAKPFESCKEELDELWRTERREKSLESVVDRLKQSATIEHTPDDEEQY